MVYTANNDWRTSLGNPAPDDHWSGNDDAAAMYAQLKAEVERNYAGARVIRTSTRTYNCHAFVHANSHAWFNDIAPFLRDDYYQYTPGTLRLNDAVVYVKDGLITHSGFIIQLSGNTIVTVRSKWGAYPLVEHPPASVPSAYGSIVYYLRKKDKAPMATGEEAEVAVEPTADILIGRMLDGERLKDLWLASTPAVAESIVRNWPEFAQLQLAGKLSGALLREKSKNLSSDARFVLGTLARQLGDDAAKTFAEAELPARL